MTKEEIESLGWKHGGGYTYNYGNSWTMYLLKDDRFLKGRIEVTTYYHAGNRSCFNGQCLDIETLKLVMKLLKITPEK